MRASAAAQYAALVADIEHLGGVGAVRSLDGASLDELADAKQALLETLMDAGAAIDAWCAQCWAWVECPHDCDGERRPDDLEDAA